MLPTRSSDDHHANAVDFYTTMSRLTRCVWSLEKAKDEIRGALHAQRAHPGFFNLQSELRKLDYLLRSLPIPRGEDGHPLHPADCGNGGAA
jgi:hypothetical protein